MVEEPRLGSPLCLSMGAHMGRRDRQDIAEYGTAYWKMGGMRCSKVVCKIGYG